MTQKRQDRRSQWLVKQDKRARRDLQMVGNRLRSECGHIDLFFVDGRLVNQGTVPVSVSYPGQESAVTGGAQGAKISYEVVDLPPSGAITVAEVSVGVTCSVDQLYFSIPVSLRGSRVGRAKKREGRRPAP